MGYTTIVKDLDLNTDISVNIQLTPGGAVVEDVVVSSERNDENIRSANMGVEEMDLKQISKISVLFGEKDH